MNFEHAAKRAPVDATGAALPKIRAVPKWPTFARDGAKVRP